MMDVSINLLFNCSRLLLMFLRVRGVVKLEANGFLELKISKSLLNVFKHLIVGRVSSNPGMSSF